MPTADVKRVDEFYKGITRIFEDARTLCSPGEEESCSPMGNLINNFAVHTQKYRDLLGGDVKPTAGLFGRFLKAKDKPLPNAVVTEKDRLPANITADLDKYYHKREDIEDIRGAASFIIGRFLCRELEAGETDPLWVELSPIVNRWLAKSNKIDEPE